MRHELDETRAVFGSAKEIAQDRLLVFLGRLPDRAGDLDLVHPDGRHVDRNGGVDASVGEDRVHGASIILKAPLWGQVDRVVKRRLGGSPAFHVRLGRRFELREPEPLGDELVDAHDRQTSGVRDDGDAVPPRDRLQREGHRQVEELLDRVRSKDAGLGEHPSAARSEPPREPVWDTAARLPASERPDFTAMTGLSFAVSRAIRTKFLGLPKFSMYARISFVSGSPCHIRRRSLRLTWALFPNEQNFAKPTPRDFAWSKIAMPRAPLCVASEIPSGSGGVGANVASMRMSGWVLITPMQFGPIIVMSYASHTASSRASRASPD